MQITIKKPKLPTIEKGTNKAVKTNNGRNTRHLFGPLRMFYDFREQSNKASTLRPMQLAALTLLLAIVSLVMYTFTSYIRSEEIGLMEVFKQVSFINITLWLAYLFFVIGINSIIYLVTRVKKLEINFHSFLSRQLLVAVVMFFFMRLVATVLILLDELLPFEISLNLRIFQFNLLTVLFISQVLLLVVVYNHLKINLKGKLEKFPLIEMGVVVLYLASIWSLTSP